MNPRDGLRPWALVAAAVVAAVLGYLSMRLAFRAQADLPEASWPAGALLAALALGLFIAARAVRETLAGRASRPVPPIGAYRLLRLARACALAGAAVTGWYLAYAAVLAPDIDAGSVQAQAIAAGATAAGGALLAVAGMRVQSACRLDPPDDEADRPDDQP